MQCNPTKGCLPLCRQIAGACRCAVVSVLPWARLVTVVAASACAEGGALMCGLFSCSRIGGQGHLCEFLCAIWAAPTMLLRRNRVANARVWAWHCARRLRRFIAALPMLCNGGQCGVLYRRWGAGLWITLSLWRVHLRFERHQGRGRAGVDAAPSSMPFVLSKVVRSMPAVSVDSPSLYCFGAAFGRFRWGL